MGAAAPCTWGRRAAEGGEAKGEGLRTHREAPAQNQRGGETLGERLCALRKKNSLPGVREEPSGWLI
jgi:hypothetical protein